MGVVQEFREFAIKGNVIDLAVGVIIGGAFGKIVSSLVDDVIMPPIGLLVGNVDFSNLYWVLKDAPNHQGVYASLAEAKKLGAVTVNMGLFINTVVSFLIIALAVFLLVRTLSRLQKPAPAPAAEPSKACPYCLNTVPLAAKRCGHCTSDLS